MTGQLSRTNTIDANGSITNDGTVGYTYNAYGRMVSSTSGGLTTTYALNGKGQRVSKTNASGTTLYLYDGAGHLIGEYDGANGNALQETVWFGDLPAVLLTGTTANAAIYNIHADHLSAPKVITDQTGNTVWNWDHGPFGKGNPTGTLTYNLRFPGQYYDEESGLYYNMNRDYDPQTGRYVESDPIGLEGGINTYGYVGQNPLWAVDPWGLLDENMIPSNEPLSKMVDKIPSVPGRLSLAAHGSPNSVWDELRNTLLAEQLAERIRRNPKYKDGMPVDLYACNTGKDPNGLAQQLAKLLHAPTSAPDKFLWMHPSGDKVVAGAKGGVVSKGADFDNLGSMKSFYPVSK